MNVAADEREAIAAEGEAKAGDLDTRGQAAREAVRRHDEAATEAREKIR